MEAIKQPLTLSEIKKRAVTSFLSLALRQVILRAISFISLNIVLAKILPVETLGIFNIAASIITFFAFFSDIGLAASLIQKKEEVTPSDIKTVFTIQQLLVGLLSLIIILGAPIISNFYNLDEGGVWLVRILGFAFFLSSLKVIPAVMLERQLKFQPLVTVEIVETLIFNLLIIVFVIKGLGIWSFSIAALSRGMIGTILIYVLAPIKLGFKIDTEAARKLLTFGVPFQANNLLALLKDKLVPLIIARLVGPLGIGYITWAQALAFLPLEIMNMVIRISFPAFSRMQEDKENLGKAVEKSLFITASLVYPALFGLMAILPSIVTYIVSAKWQPAMPSFYFFAFSTFWAVISTTLTNTLNALGRVKTTLKLMVIWTVLTWILTPILVLSFGFIGVALSSFLISFTSVLTIIWVKRILVINIIDAVLKPIISSVLMSGIVYWVAKLIVRDLFTLIGVVLLGLFIHGLLMWILEKEKIKSDIKNIRYA